VEEDERAGGPTLTDVSRVGWTGQPFRVLFPLGLVMIWAGVLHWFLHGVGILSDYRPVFHSIVQVQGFLMCFAVGFLFTAIPRRTGTASPAPWQLFAAIAAPLGSSVAAWFQRWALSQAIWVLLVAVLLQFAVSRFLSATASRRPPSTFVWIPISFAIGLVGAVLIGAYGILGEEYYRLHALGQIMLLQGMFLGLVIGAGGLILPVVTQGQGPPDASGVGSTPIVAHVLAAITLIASFWVETEVSLRGGLALRGLVVLAVLIGAGKIARLPKVPGWHRWWIWLAAWLIPLGYFLAALTPFQKKAGLHVVFVGGFALMALSVGLHVTLAHGGREDLVRGRPWQVPVYGVLTLVAMVLRGLVDFDPQRFFLWLACASASLLLATLVWASLVFAPPPRS